MPPPGRLLRPPGHGRRADTAARSGNPPLGCHHGRHRRAVIGVLATALLVAERPPQRHGLGQVDLVPFVPVGPRPDGRRLPHQRPAPATGGHRRSGWDAPVDSVPPSPRVDPRPVRPGAGVGLHPPARGPPLQRSPPARLLPEPLPAGGDSRGRGAAPCRARHRRVPGPTRRHWSDSGRLRRARRDPDPDRLTGAATAGPPRWDHGRQHLPVDGPGHRRVEPRPLLGAVELRRIRGTNRRRNGWRVGRTPRPGHDHDRGGRPARLWPAHVGVLQRPDPVRHADGADAAAPLDRWLRGVDGRALFRIGHQYPLPLPYSVGVIYRPIAGPKEPPLPVVRPGGGD